MVSEALPVCVCVCTYECTGVHQSVFLALRLMATPVFDLRDFFPPLLFEECLFEAVNIANTLLNTA